MPNLTVFSGDFCNADRVVREVRDATGMILAADHDVIEKAAGLSGLDTAVLARAFSSKTSIFNKFTHEKERCVAWIKLAVAELLAEDNRLVHGFSSLLVPGTIGNTLRACLIAEMGFRVEQAMNESGFGEKEALKYLHSQDQERMSWSETVLHDKDPWSAKHYDMLIPMDKKSVSEASAMIREHLKSDIVATDDTAARQIDDFRLAATVEVKLAAEGHNVDVFAEAGKAVIIINKHVLMLSRLEEELTSLARQVEGVKEVETKVGKDFYQSDIYRKYDFEAPAKVLLVDDEREFVETLSERLLMRDVGAAVVYDGESALDVVREDEPEVMILDLKMPGINGIEVLRRVKRSKPEVEVIILTGHGSEEDKRTCMELGAFDYLHKPVDINRLSESLEKAQEKIRQRKEQKG